MTAHMMEHMQADKGSVAPVVERVIGSTRRKCLDDVIIWNERALRRHLRQYLSYYHQWRTHLSFVALTGTQGSPARRR